MTVRHRVPCQQGYPETPAPYRLMPKKKYRGIVWMTRERAWRVQLKYEGQRFYWPHQFDDAVVAARVWDAIQAAIPNPNVELNFDGVPPAEVLLVDIYDWLREVGLRD